MLRVVKDGKEVKMSKRLGTSLTLRELLDLVGKDALRFFLIERSYNSKIDFDIEKVMENFSMKECKQANIYPDIWNYEEETDEIKEELMDYFQNLKDFYKKILEVNGNVMVTIC